MTINMKAKLHEPAIELSKLRCGDGNISPINKNGMQPKPTEKPIMNTIKLVSGRNLEWCEMRWLNVTEKLWWENDTDSIHPNQIWANWTNSELTASFYTLVESVSLVLFPANANVRVPSSYARLENNDFSFEICIISKIDLISIKLNIEINQSLTRIHAYHAHSYRMQRPLMQSTDTSKCPTQSTMAYGQPDRPQTAMQYCWSIVLGRQ